ncbi:MAG: hypothetical protein ACPGRZ_14725 [Alphaproteobacteria bacterium]
MSGDSTVSAALAHWAPRLVANGIPLTDFQEVTAAIDTWDDWCAAWSRRAAVHEDMGRTALDDGYTLSAAEHLKTAALCYHFGKFSFCTMCRKCGPRTKKRSIATGRHCPICARPANASTFPTKERR